MVSKLDNSENDDNVEPTIATPEHKCDLPATSTTKRNAFSELMSSKSKQHKPLPETTPAVQPPNEIYTYDRGNGLLRYILNPESFPSEVITYTEHTVLIRDLYPKATVHLLLLPRDATKYNLHPHAAFQDPQFLSLMRSESLRAVQLASSELSRLISPYSESSRARLKAMMDDNSSSSPSTTTSSLPPGRDFVRDIRTGIHAHPSMNHLHVHVISRDMHSPAMKHRKHYNSFNTDFFIPLDDYPLDETDERRKTRFQNENLKRDFVCWRCGREFGNRFARLKEHLEAEFEQWKQE